MAQTIALRETSVIVAALIGVGLMKEGSGARRIAAAATVVAGNLLLQIF
jgi:drug/metabolite transporter (DMT)-like permease